MALGMLAVMIESASKHIAITCSAGGSACRRDADGELALGLLADMAGSTRQLNTIAYTLAIALAGRVVTDGWRYAC